MLAIKFRNRKHVKIKNKIEIVNSVFDIISITKRKKLFYSTYTFSEVEDSEVVQLIDDLMEHNILNKLDDEHFITLTAETSYGSIRAEINPKKARKNIPNCSHIDINIEDESALYDRLEPTVINRLTEYFDEKREIISEFYFFDLNQSPDCYSDIKNRLFMKVYDEVEFANLLMSDSKFEDRVEEKTIRAIGYNFTQLLFQEDRQQFVQAIIQENNLNATAAAGSLVLYGKDSAKFIEIILEKLYTYIAAIKGKNLYSTEFDNLYK